MADPNPPRAEQVRAAYRWQGDFCHANESPITAAVNYALAEVLDDGSAVGRRALNWAGDPVADALPLRTTAPFHALYRAGRCSALNALFQGATEQAPQALRAAIAEHDAWIAQWLDGPPQTNEPARSAAFVAGLMVMAGRFGLPFDLFEIGSSAGLNLLIDRYRYDLAGVTVGPADSPVTIRPEWRGEALPCAPVAIRSVRGVDIAPIDVTAPGAVDRLLAYVWIDQGERFTRMERALEMARAQSPRLDQGDAAGWVEDRLAEPQPAGVARVLMHSIVWQYLPPQGQARIETAMAAAGAHATAERPLGWVMLEADRAKARHYLTVRMWPGGGAPRVLARVHPHGAWIDWGATDGD